MRELVSILIPAFNAEDWIASSIESALNQDWPHKEIIIVDDGSTDLTLQVAKRYESRLVKVVAQPNQGACVARNRALSYAQGGYIQWLDADDILAPNKITSQLNRVDYGPNSGVLISSSWGRFFYRHRDSIFTPTSLWQNLTPVEWLYRKMNENNWMAIESWLVNRRLTEMAGPWNERLCMDDDGEYFSRVIAGSDKIVFVPDARCFCRKGIFGSQSSLQLLSERKLESQLLSIRLSIECMLSLENSERTRSAALRYLQAYLIYFFPEHKQLLSEASNLAQDLGGKLSPPALNWKYSVIKECLGWTAVKYAMRKVSEIKLSVYKYWDRLLLNLSG